ncbi:hypothetical protein D7319_11310 [Streptomyces radicis]|uniref:Uncharacterized protein n=1 Tax=Streptomyces radicis TaxID=1750517 RepID=A0A3A9WJM5_9ACTN|nr:hypothetical protein D7319_11310 [Streptomyces radicis]
MASVDPRLDSIVAHMPEVRAEVREELERRAARVRAVVAAHVATGALSRSLDVEVSNPDSTVSIADPAIISINYGHHTVNGVWVEGIHAIEAGLT